MDLGVPLWILGVAVVGVLVIAAGVLMLVVSAGGGSSRAGARPPGRVRPLPERLHLVAVVPFRTESDRPDLAAFSAGLTALVRRHLFCIEGLSVLTTEDTPGGEWSEIRELFTKAGRETLVVAKVTEVAQGLSIEVGLRSAASAKKVGPADAPFEAKVLGPYEGPFDLLPELAERLALDATAALGAPVGAEERRAVTSCRPAKPPSVMRLGMAMTVGQIGRATELLEQAIQEDRTFAPLYVELARVVGDTNPERAVALLEEAIRLDPDHAPPYWQLSMLYIFRFSGRSSDALALCEQAIERAPGFGQARILRGNFLSLLGGGPQEAEERRIAIRLLPGSPHAWANQGKVLATQGDPAGAVTAFEHALARDDAHADALEGIVGAARALGDAAMTLHWAERRMEIENPLRAGRPGDEGAGDEIRFLEAADHALAAATQLGDTPAMERIGQKALAVDPAFKPAKKALGR